MKRKITASILVSTLMVGNQAFGIELQAQALMKDMAVLLVDNKRRTVRAGGVTPEGVKLISADRKQAIIEWQGQRDQLTLTTRINSNFTKAKTHEVVIPRDRANQYTTNAMINGYRVPVLVDTGATTVALSASQASGLGIDYKKGIVTSVSTASGIAKAYQLKLNTVAIGNITINSVPAVVVEGSFPAIALLGMSYLRHVDMSEKNGLLILQTKL